MLGRLIISILIPQLAGGFGALATASNIPTWYATINKPFFNPPNWLFGPVWTLLFLLMGISLYLVWTKKKFLTHSSLNWFWIQLGLNVLWSLLFFGAKNPGLALIEIFILWYAIYKTIITFSRINKQAAIMLYPYLAWVSFATLLNAAIFWLNR